MKKIPLTQGKNALVDDEDYDWLMTWKWHADKIRDSWYVSSCSVYEKGVTRKIRMHRLVMMYPKDLQVDHINHNGLDNRKCNLRVVDNRVNHHNFKKQHSSKYPGVCWNRFINKWTSSIFVNGKNKTIGNYDDEIYAAISYQNVHMKYKGANRG